MRKVIILTAFLIAFLACSGSRNKPVSGAATDPKNGNLYNQSGSNPKATTEAVETPPENLFGDYSGAGCSHSDSSEHCLNTSPSDHIRLRHGADQQVEAEVHLVFHSQTCHLKAPAVWVNHGFTIRAEGLDADKPCELRINVHENELALNDLNNRCREVYCGTRGSFTGARFKKRPRP